MVEIDIKINGALYDRVHVCNTDVQHLGLTTYSVTTFNGRREFTVAHTQKNGLYELLSRVFENGNLKHSGKRNKEKEQV